MNDFDFSGVTGAGNRATISGAAGEKLEKTKKTKGSGRTPTNQAGLDKKSTDLLFATFPQLASPDIDQKMLVDILKKLEVDLFQNQLSGETEVIKTDQEQMANLTKSNQKRLADQMQKVEDQKSASVLSKIFGWLGAILGVVLGVVLAIVSFGTGATAAGLLITASVVMAVTITILTATGAMDKIVSGLAQPMEKMLEAFGVDSKKAKQIAQMTTQVVVTIALIVVQIVMAALSGGATAANFASELANKIASISMKIANFALAANQIAAAAAGTASASYNYEAMEDQSSTEKDKAILKKISTLIDDEKDTIKEIIQFLLSSQKEMGQLIKSENENRGVLADIGARSATV